jgi:sulfur carrier protein
MAETFSLNGKQQPLAAATVRALLEQEEIADARGVAVALNGAVVPRAEWDRTQLNAGDTVEIVRARQGG